ncbi:hypothetical protein DFJ58DRAFT_730067 [Suillus subalutaceus]|uniref:uncharacterized protein n=1 Tax=Suillus subalutaceus TaxID=48586 RepID=UPI001B86B63F|nr:uncharacterized protein DFJ58DRAFT_730067 [Suillus subalutaceus]KAG1847654.1 hypothetical protein DFJ58DRAFT_730067 [Suillus subalutaceus]
MHIYQHLIILFFPPVCDVHPSLTLKTAVVHTCDGQDGALSDSLAACEITRDTDAGHARFAEYTTSETVSDLDDAVQYFQSVLDKCPVGPRNDSHQPSSCSLAVYRSRRSEGSQGSLHQGNTTRISNELRTDLIHVLKLKRRPRIWLCPTAAFTSIPLHAANPFADRSKEPCMGDLYICSYTPTLSTLIKSRRMKKKCVPPSFDKVNQVQGKARRYWLSTASSSLSISSSLRRRIIPLFLATQPHEQQAGSTYNSHFVMRDEHLTLLDIMDKDISHAEFAFLSACHTAVGDEETPDEVIHQCGGRLMPSQNTSKLSYKYMSKDLEDGGVMDCTKAAWALDCATHAVKTKVPLEQWMVFIHIGV